MARGAHAGGRDGLTAGSSRTSRSDPGYRRRCPKHLRKPDAGEPPSRGSCSAAGRQYALDRVGRLALVRSDTPLNRRRRGRLRQRVPIRGSLGSRCGRTRAFSVAARSVARLDAERSPHGRSRPSTSRAAPEPARRNATRRPEPIQERAPRTAILSSRLGRPAEALRGTSRAPSSGRPQGKDQRTVAMIRVRRWLARCGERWCSLQDPDTRLWSGARTERSGLVRSHVGGSRSVVPRRATVALPSGGEAIRRRQPLVMAWRAGLSKRLVAFGRRCCLVWSLSGSLAGAEVRLGLDRIEGGRGARPTTVFGARARRARAPVGLRA